MCVNIVNWWFDNDDVMVYWRVDLLEFRVHSWQSQGSFHDLLTTISTTDVWFSHVTLYDLYGNKWRVEVMQLGMLIGLELQSLFCFTEHGTHAWRKGAKVLVFISPSIARGRGFLSNL